MVASKTEVLRRYTNIPSLLHTLTTRTITLLDPKKWDDTNDSYALEVYRDRMDLKSVLALCFSQANETYHHWHVFAGGAGGACILFDKQRLMKAFDKQGVRHKGVTYKTLPKLEKETLSLEDLPFTKRYGFKDEEEFRAIYECQDEEVASLPISIPLNAISRVSLSPWLPQSLFDTTKDILRSIDGCAGLKVSRSTLTGSRVWKDAADRAD